MQAGQIMQSAGQLQRRVRPPFEDGDGALQQRRGIGEPALGAKCRRQIVQAAGDCTVARPQGRFPQIQRRPIVGGGSGIAAGAIGEAATDAERAGQIERGHVRRRFENADGPVDRRGRRGDIADPALQQGVIAQLLRHHRVDDARYAEGVAAFGETGMIELVATVGYYCLVSLTLNAFRVPLAEGMTDPFPGIAD